MHTGINDPAACLVNIQMTLPTLDGAKEIVRLELIKTHPVPSVALCVLG